MRTDFPAADGPNVAFLQPAVVNPRPHDSDSQAAGGKVGSQHFERPRTGRRRKRVVEVFKVDVGQLDVSGRGVLPYVGGCSGAGGDGDDPPVMVKNPCERDLRRGGIGSPRDRLQRRMFE